MSKFKSKIIIFFLFSLSANAMIPLDKLVLGNFFEHFPEKIETLDLFMKPIKKSSIKQQKQLQLFRGFYQEGENLENFCINKKDSSQFDFSERQQVKQSYIATFQYVGLDITARALSKYALLFDFSTEEYQHLVDYLTGNYCSANLTVIGHTKLKKNIMAYFNDPHSFAIPSIKDNPLFSHYKEIRNDTKKHRKQEFLHTIKLFQAFCSWGNNPDNLRLLVPLLKNPSLSAFVIRHMAAKKIGYSSGHNIIQDDATTSQIWCDHLICRKKTQTEFEKKLTTLFEGEDISNTLSYLYCKEFKNAKYKIKDQVVQIKKIISKRDQSEENLMTSQMISLITGIPNLLLWVNKFNDGKKILQDHINEKLDYWASMQNASHNKTLYFEESLSFELVDRKFYFERTLPRFKVIIDVNSGEFDRVNQMIGKLSATFDIKLNYSYLKWLRTQWNLPMTEKKIKKARQKLKQTLVLRIEGQTNHAVNKLGIPVIKNKLNSLVAKEILSQIERYRGVFFKQQTRDPVKISIIFNYAPFALKYNRYRHRYKRKLESLKKNNQDILSKKL